MSPIHIFYFLTLALFWGASFLAIHYVVGSLPPAFGAFLRVLVAFLAVSVLMCFRPRAVKTPLKLRSKAIGIGVLNMGLPWLLLFYGERTVSPAVSSIYNSTSTIFAAIFTPMILIGAHLSKRNVLGVLIGFCGILTVFLPHIGSDDRSMMAGQLAIIVMAAFYGLGVVLLKQISHEIRTTRSLFYQTIGGMIVLGIFSVSFERPWAISFTSVPLITWMSVLYLAICSTFISWLMYMKLIRERGAVQAASVTYLMPVVSVVLDIIVLKKMVGPFDILGSAVILFGVYLIQHKKRYEVGDRK